MPTTKQTQKKTRSTTGRGPARPKRSARARPAARRAQEEVQPDEAQVQELVLQALETELGGVQVYQTAVACAVNRDLKEEWQEYLGQTRRHVEIVEGLCQRLGFDPEEETPGRLVVRQLGESLVAAMQKAQASGPPEAAELVAAECVVLAETKDHQNWELMGELAEAFGDERAAAFEEACGEVEDEEDEHLYHTMGWARELWIQSLGLPAVLPPPEEKKDARSAIEAARAKGQRKALAKKAR